MASYQKASSIGEDCTTSDAHNDRILYQPIPEVLVPSENQTSISRWDRNTILVAVSAAVIGLIIGVVLDVDGGVTSPMSDGIPLLGSSKYKKGKKKRQNKDQEVFNFHCHDGKYSKSTMKTLYEMEFAALFKDTRGQKKFEASDVIIVGDFIYSICDSSWAISRFHRSLTPFDEANLMIGDPNRDPDEESGYEAILHDEGIFYVVRESVAHEFEDAEGKRYHAIIEELSLDQSETDYSILDQCRSEFEFEGDSKGFEGAVGVRDANGEFIILGLCEGNHCSEERKSDRGNGKLVAMKKAVVDGSCIWKTIRIIDIPSSAYFKDYSSIALDITNSRVAISSQEDSSVWIGYMDGITPDGVMDIGTAEFVPDGDNWEESRKSSIYQFEKSHNCETVYCNVEGIHWLNDEILVGVSDKMKSKGRQDFTCFDKDQSVHVFMLPK